LINNQSSLPKFFKGIALFTPGGDLIYGIDSNKQARWHIHLCATLQEILGLSEPPHFLIPSYTATVDRWLDPLSQQIITLGEVYPAVQRYQPLLKVIFETEDSFWQVPPWQEAHCDPMIIEAYREQFPQLWQDHDLIVRLNSNHSYYWSENSLSELKEFTKSKQNSTIVSELTSTKESNLDLEEAKLGSSYQKSDRFSATSKGTEGYILRLFISSDNLTVEKTLARIHQLLEHGLAHPYTLKVIDISQHPEQAELHQVSATPTLVRVWPEPVRRIVGELDDLPRVLRIISSY
jgi:circadian clock protein KaiB